MHSVGTPWCLACYDFGVSAFPAQEPAAERHPAAGANPLWIFWDSGKQPIRMCWCSPGVDGGITSIEERLPYPLLLLCWDFFAREKLSQVWFYSVVGIMVVQDCDLLVFRGHLLQETDGPNKHKLYHGSSKFSTTNFSRVTSPCGKPSGKLCLVKSLGSERCEIHRSITLRQEGTWQGVSLKHIPVLVTSSCSQALALPPGWRRLRSGVIAIALSQKLKHQSAGIRSSFPIEGKAGIAQY